MEKKKPFYDRLVKAVQFIYFIEDRVLVEDS
jgi:hypothetical protein